MKNQVRFLVLAGSFTAALAAAQLSVSATPSTKASTTQVVAATATSDGDSAKGSKLFATNCAACHGAHAEGGMGPSLKGEKGKKNFAAAVAWIKNPTPPMPKLYPSPLSDEDVKDLAAFVETL